MKGRLQAISLVAGVFLGCLAFNVLARRAALVDLQSPGLGRETTACSVSRFNGTAVSGYPSACQTIAESAREFQSDGCKVVLWLGASQLHAINEYAHGDQLAVVNANQSAAERGAKVRYVQVSEANANLNEILAFYLLFRQHGVKPDVLVVAVVYDDLKERGVRRSDAQAVRSQLDRWRAIGGKGVGNILDEVARHDQEGGLGQESPVKRNAISGTPQEALENTLMKGMEGMWPAFRARDLIRAAAEIWVRSTAMNVLRRFRPPTKVEIPADLAQWNMDGLDSLLAIARADGVQVLLYEQP